MEQVDKKVELQRQAINHILGNDKLIKNFWANNLLVSDEFINTINRQAPNNIKWLVRASLSIWCSKELSLFDLCKNLEQAELKRVSEALTILAEI